MARNMTLLELNGLVRELIEQEMGGEYWVEAELSEVRENRGHCFMELIQRDERSATPIARASAKCWASRWMIVRPHFERTTGQVLHTGMKVLLKVYAQFHEAYGFSWIITDIDPNYTLGDQARRRQEIIRQLKVEGVYDLQRELRLPLFCQHIAVVSSATAAGYGDFCNHLANNPYGFKFQPVLFEATMQGEGVETSIISALEKIYSLESGAENGAFDCVVIIRGGGATSDMSGFDTLALAENVANFPIPVITGIGHDRDESILDMVSHQRVKTPTAAADFLIANLKRVMDAIETAQTSVVRSAQQRMTLLQTQLAAMSEAIPRLFSVVRTRQESRLDALSRSLAATMQQKLVTNAASIEAISQRLPMLAERRLMEARHSIEIMEQRVKSSDPTLLLRRGYSVTLKDGRAVRDAAVLNTGDEIETRLANGIIHSTVTK